MADNATSIYCLDITNEKAAAWGSVCCPAHACPCSGVPAGSWGRYMGKGGGRQSTCATIDFSSCLSVSSMAAGGGSVGRMSFQFFAAGMVSQWLAASRESINGVILAVR